MNKVGDETPSMNKLIIENVFVGLTSWYMNHFGWNKLTVKELFMNVKIVNEIFIDAMMVNETIVDEMIVSERAIAEIILC